MSQNNFRVDQGISFNGGANIDANATININVGANTVTVGTNGSISTAGNVTANNITAQGNLYSAHFTFTEDTIINQTTSPIYLQTDAQVWQFGTNGNITLPSNSAAINYANGSPYSGGGGNTGNIAFINDSMYDFNGIAVENADLSHGATAALVIPPNASTSPIQLNNFYGNITLQASATGSGNLQSLTLGGDGTLTVPGAINALSNNNASLNAYDNGGTPFVQLLNWNVANSAPTTAVSVEASNVAIVTNISGGGSPYQWTFDNTGNLTAPGNVTAVGFTTTGGSGNITGADVISANTFSASGNITGAYAFFSDVTLNDLSANAILYTDANRNVWNTDFSYDANTNTISGGNISLTGNITGNVANLYAINTSQSITWPGGSQVYEDSGLVLQGTIGVAITSPGTTGITAGTRVWLLENDGTLNLPDSSSTGNAIIQSTSNVQINANANFWTFENAGNLNLPQGGVVYETDIPFGGLSGKTIALKPSGGSNADQRLLVYPTTGADNNHLHLTSGNLYSTELFLGDDNLYVKLANSGDIVINSNNGVGSAAQWTFGTDTNLSVPGNTIIFTPIAIGGAGGNNITIQAGSSDSFSVFPGGNLNLIGGYGSFGDGGGPPGGNVNITSGGSSDSHVGNVYITTGSNNWVFDYTGNLNLPGNTFAVNYANGTQVSLGGGGNSISDGTSNVTVTGSDGNVVIGVDNDNMSWNFATDGNIYGKSDTDLKFVVVDTGSNGYAVKQVTNNGTDDVTKTTLDNYSFQIETGLAPGDTYNRWQFNGNVFQTPDTGAIVRSYNSSVSFQVMDAGGNPVASLQSVSNQNEPNVFTSIDATRTGANIIAWTSGGSDTGTANTWQFTNTGNLVLPGNTFSVNYANGTPVSLGGTPAALANSTATFTLGTDGGLLTSSSGTPTNFVVNSTTPDIDLRNASGTGSFTQGATCYTIRVAGGNNLTLNSSGLLSAPGDISTTGNVTAGNIIGNGSTLSNIATKTTGSWTLATGVNTVSLTVPLNGTYSIWVNGNIPNGIVTYTATVVITNNNVPALGSQYGWYYAAGNALVLTSLPDQIVGTVGAISTATAVTTTSNVFTFGITNNSGSSQVVNWGYTKL